MLGGARTASDVQSTAHTRDRTFFSGHAEIQPRDTVSLEVSGTQYSCFFDKSYHVGAAVIGHESRLYLTSVTKAMPTVGRGVFFGEWVIIYKSPTYCKTLGTVPNPSRVG